MKTELLEFKRFLIEEEKSANTIEKYIREVNRFLDYINYASIDKDVVIEYKKHLINNYAISSVNSNLSSINSYFVFLNRNDLKVKYEKIQKSSFRDQDKELSKEEYYKLLDVAKRKRKTQLWLILQTLASTGIRISEINFLTVESLYENEIVITLKGKTRKIFLPDRLCNLLIEFCKESKKFSGPVFLTRNRKTIDRSSIWRQIKILSRDAGISSEKAYPHNFRHLFALIYYEKTKDIVHLSDILGHSNINTTRIYTQSSINVIKKELNHLDLVL